MININDKNGGLSIIIQGNTMRNLLTINTMVMELSKSSEEIASTFIFGVIQAKGKDFVKECLEREDKAKTKTNAFFDSATNKDIKDLLKEMKEILFEGEEDE